MQTIHVNGVDIAYTESKTPGDTLVFSHGYFMDHSMFDGQVRALKKHFNCICYDHRGHGQSAAPKGDYTLDTLVNDAIALIENLGVGPVHFAGMSTGGFVGMRIALKRPDLIKSLCLIDTSAEAEPMIKRPKYYAMLAVIRTLGCKPILPLILHGLFHTSFLKDKNNKPDIERWKNIISTHPKHSITAFGRGIFTRDNVLNQLPNINCPTAIVVGQYDKATKPACSKRMAKQISGAKLYSIANAGHTAAIEKADEVSKALLSFYQNACII